MYLKRSLYPIFYLCMIGILSFFSGVGSTTSLFTESTTTLESAHDMALTKKYIDEHLPSLANMDDYHKAAMLRNFVYVNTPRVGSIGPNLVPMTYEKFLHYIEGKSPLKCGGMSLEYSALLSVYGIPSRLVYLKTEDTFLHKTKNDTHVAVEVYVNNQWIVQDPTFNIHWSLNGHPLGMLELADAFLVGEKPQTDSDGYPLLSNKPQVETYYLPYQDFLAHFVISRCIMWGPEPCEGRWIVDTIYPEPEDVAVEPIRVADDLPMLTYDFSHGVDSNWIVSDPSTTHVSQKEKQAMLLISGTVPPGKSVEYVTDVTALCHPYGYVLKTAMPVTLNPGHYQMVFDGSIDAGGIILGVVDFQSNVWINQTPYRYNKVKKGSRLVSSFTIESSGKYDLVLSNNATVYKEISRWSISKISLIKVSE